MEVTEKQVLNEEEFNILNEIRTQTQETVMELGEVSLLEYQISKRKEKAQSLLDQINSKEQAFIDEIRKKYGNISLNPETGEYAKLD